MAVGTNAEPVKAKLASHDWLSCKCEIFDYLDAFKLTISRSLFQAQMKLAGSPIAFEQYDPHTKQLLKQNFGVLNNLETVWPGGICLPSTYRDIADKVYNLPLRPSDVWVLSFPKTGKWA